MTHIVCTLRDEVAGFLAPSVTTTGLDGPMPGIITPVMPERCRPSPNRVLQSAPAHGHRGGVMASHLSFGAGQRLAPVLVAPHRGVCRIDGHDGDAVFGGHGNNAGLELAGGHAGDELPEPLPTAVLLAGLLGGEVQVLDPDGLRTALFGPVQEAGEGVPDLGVAVFGGARQVVGEAAGSPTGSPCWSRR